MINLGLADGVVVQADFSEARYPRQRPLDPFRGLAHGVFMNGLLAICGICREIMS
jgi:hypothetical protein